jgi:hypothetical protein
MNRGHAYRSITLAVAFVFAALPAVGAPSGGAAPPASGGAANSGSNAAGSSSSSAAPGGAAASGTSGYQNTSVFLRLAHRTLFVLVYGPDAATTNYLGYEVSLLLGSKVYRNLKDHKAGFWRMTSGTQAEPNELA